MSHSEFEGSPFVAPGRPLLALSLLASFRDGSSEKNYAVMIPQVKAQSSRATAVTATCEGLPRLTSRV